MRTRLNKFLSLCGVAARRKSDILIQNGEVSVNGVLEIKPQTLINPDKDIVRFNGQILAPQIFEYYIMNKPRFCLTSMSRTEKKKTILDYLPNTDIKIFPIGRLDFDTEGLLLFTNDGEFAHKISHPSFMITKTYICHLNGKVSQALIKKMRSGATLSDGFLKPNEITLVKNNIEESIIKITIHEGRNHIVKNFFKYFTKKVNKLKRISIGSINLGELETGKTSKLDYNEVIKLKKQMQIKESQCL